MKKPNSKIPAIITVTHFSENAAEVLRTVREEGRTVPVTLRGEVVAVVRPSSVQAAVLAVDLDDTEKVFSSRELERSGPSPVVHAARHGLTCAVTFQNRPFALVSPVSSWDEFDEVLAKTPEAGEHVPDSASYTVPKEPAAQKAHTVEQAQAARAEHRRA